MIRLLYYVTSLVLNMKTVSSHAWGRVYTSDPLTLPRLCSGMSFMFSLGSVHTVYVSWVG